MCNYNYTVCNNYYNNINIQCIAVCIYTFCIFVHTVCGVIDLTQLIKQTHFVFILTGS